MALRGNLNFGTNPVINLLLYFPSKHQRVETEEVPVSPVIRLPTHPPPAPPPVPPLLLVAHSRLYLSPSEQSGEQSCIAVWCVKLCGYANVSGLVGVLLNGCAEEVNKRVWMRGGGQRVKEMK